MIEFSITTPLNLSERQGRMIVKAWVDEWLAEAVGDSRYGVGAVAQAARNLRAAIQDFERANSGDNGK